MEYKLFKLLTSANEYQAGYYWKADEQEDALVVIVHGMAEHLERYDDFAKFLNKNNYSVFGLDHIGHGLNFKEGAWDKDTFDACVDGFRTLIVNLTVKHKPIYLLGHSMGSYMVQYYMEKYGDNPLVNKVILSGTSGPRGAFKLGSKMANLVAKFKPIDKPSKFIDSLAFGSMNNGVKKEERITPHAWLSHDEETLRKYEEDPLCGFLPNLGFYCSFFKYLTVLHSNKMRKKTPKNVPILIIGGNQDPVTLYGKGMEKLHAIYSGLEIKSELKILDGYRHEILNEINKQYVYDYILNYIK